MDIRFWCPLVVPSFGIRASFLLFLNHTFDLVTYLLQWFSYFLALILMDFAMLFILDVTFGSYAFSPSIFMRVAGKDLCHYIRQRLLWAEVLPTHRQKLTVPPCYPPISCLPLAACGAPPFFVIKLLPSGIFSSSSSGNRWVVIWGVPWPMLPTSDRLCIPSWSWCL